MLAKIEFNDEARSKACGYSFSAMFKNISWVEAPYPAKATQTKAMMATVAHGQANDGAIKAKRIVIATYIPGSRLTPPLS